MDMNELGRRMKIYRATHDLSQYDLGKKIGADHTKISRLENGQMLPTAKQAAKLRKLGLLEQTA